MLPRFWMAERLLTMTCWRAIRAAPWASVTVVIIGRNSGVRPDGERHGEEQRLERGPVHRQARGQDDQHEHEDRPRDEQAEVPQPALELGLRRARGEPGDDVAELGRAPGRHDARGRRSADDRRAEPNGAATGRPPARRGLFSAGSDSPVSAASCTCRSRASSRRASAGTRSPAARRTTSPGTTSRRGSSTHVRLAGRSPWARPAAAASRRPSATARSGTRLMATLKTTIPAMSAASISLAQQRREAARHEQDQRERVAEQRQELGERRLVAARGLVRTPPREKRLGLRGGQALRRGGVHGAPYYALYVSVRDLAELAAVDVDDRLLDLLRSCS